MTNVTSKLCLKLLPCLVLITLVNGCLSPLKEKQPTIHSTYVNDDFEIYIDLPPGYSPDSSYAVAFYMDANLRLGGQLRHQIRLKENAQNLSKVVFVGIGHTGNYRFQRRRDFIPPNMENGKVVQSKAVNFGHADDFYKFLTLELIPHISEQYPNNGNYSYIGHSFSGLFAFYSMTQPQQVFRNYIALSPSLWVNYDNFFEIESAFSHSTPTLSTYLYHACGTREWANKVLSSSRRMKDTLDNRAYTGLSYEYVEHPGEGHNGVVPVSLGYILKNTEF